MSFLEDLKDKLRLLDPAAYRVQLIGGRGVAVEGHKGVYEVGDSVIRIKVRRGSLTVSGEGLKLIEISDTEVFISGVIKGITV